MTTIEVLLEENDYLHRLLAIAEKALKLCAIAGSPTARTALAEIKLIRESL